jgi:tetratricopeptide (TPR) repeat protein
MIAPRVAAVVAFTCLLLPIAHGRSSGIVQKVYVALRDCVNVLDVQRNLKDCTEVILRGESESAGNRAIAHFNRGLAHMHNKDWKEALADHDTALQLKPGYVDPVLNRGILYFRRQEFDRALAEFDAALLLTKAAIIYNERGRTYHAKGDWA